MKTLTRDEYQTFLKRHFNGKLEVGKHMPGDKACLFEAYAATQDMSWTDDPVKLRMWNLRPLNDINVDSETRIKHIVPVLIAYQGSLDWPEEKQKAVVVSLIILTVNKLLSKYPGLPKEVVDQCLNAQTLEEAKKAAYAAGRAGAVGAKGLIQPDLGAEEKIGPRGVVGIAWAAAAAETETWTVPRDAEVSESVKTSRKKFFILACQVYLEAVEAYDSQCRLFI